MQVKVKVQVNVNVKVKAKALNGFLFWGMGLGRLYFVSAGVQYQQYPFVVKSSRKSWGLAKFGNCWLAHTLEPPLGYDTC